MATLSFRPPQFSDDVAWLPAWLQSNQSPTSSHNDVVCQNVGGSFEEEKWQIKESNLSRNSENGYNICRLHLSGEDNTPSTLTPCEKQTLHFNLHLSTLETSSIISSPLLCTSQGDEKKNPTLSPLNSREKTPCNKGHDSPQINIVPSSIENFSDKQTPLNNNGMENTLDISNHKCVECDDIRDAIELSIAASEALVIHKASQSEPLSDTFSMSAILEVALRVKQARIDGNKESSFCTDKFGDIEDILSDLGDSDMKDAYNDVGLDNNFLEEPSTSRVKETPLSESLGEEKEVQCGFKGDGGFNLVNNIVIDFVENCPVVNKLEDFPDENFDDGKVKKLLANQSVDWICGNHLQNGSLDDLQPEKEGKIGMTCLDGSPLQIRINSSQHSRQEHVTFPSKGMIEATGNESTKFKSRWFGGWTGMDTEKSNVRHRKTISYFIEETSYLSESADIFPDQNSVVNNCHPSSNASESNKGFQDSHNITSQGAFVSQELVKCSTSLEDPLCSVVPCSISEEISNSIQPSSTNNNHQTSDAFKGLPFGKENPFEISQNRSLEKNDKAGEREYNELELDDASLVIQRKETFLSTYSTGPPSFFVDKKIDFGIVNIRENDALEKQVSDKQPPFKSDFKCIDTSNNSDNHGDYEFRGLVQQTFEKNDNLAKRQVLIKDVPTSPLILCHRKRRFKPPKLPLSSVATTKQLKHHGPTFEKSFEIKKRVHFTDDTKVQNRQDHVRKKLRRISSCDYRFSRGIGTGPEIRHGEYGVASLEVKERLTKCRLTGGNKPIFQGLDFLLTGFSKNKEKEIEGLLRKHGGMVLSDIPAFVPLQRRRRALKVNAEKLPVVLCTKKLQTTRFLYGCAVNAFLLKVSWTYNSIRAGSVLPPDKYLILSNRINGKLNQIGKSICQVDKFDHIFEKVGIMLHGTHSFCSKLGKVIKYGQGHVYKSLQWLIQSLENNKISLAVIVVEDKNHATRHLKKCAFDQKITVMPAKWIINSLYEGKLLPLTENKHSSNSRIISVSKVYNPDDWSQEI